MQENRKGEKVMDLSDLAKSIEQQAQQAIQIQPEDYQKDGIWYCGKCNTRKQSEVVIGGELRKPMCLCKCEDEKRKAEEQERIEQAKQRAWQESLEQMHRYSMMDERYKNASFDDFEVNKDNKQAFEAGKAFAKNFGLPEFAENFSGLLLMGDVGTGKTFLSACIANNLIARGYKVVLTNPIKILSANYEEQQNLMDKLAKADLLILDDMGTERRTSYSNERLYNLINDRYNSKKHLIVSTNYKIGELLQDEDLITRQLYDRIFAMCMPIGMYGKSYRLQEMEKHLQSNNTKS